MSALPATRPSNDMLKLFLIYVATLIILAACTLSLGSPLAVSAPHADAATVAGPVDASSGCRQVSQGVYDCTSTETKERVYDLARSGQLKWIEPKNARRVTVTGYTSRIEETDAEPCISADGSDICARHARGERICATNDWKLGTILHIEGLGDCTVRDRMNRRYTGTYRVDWYFGHDLRGARAHGARQLHVHTAK